MNRIILIGNGFDLAHGLKTSYKHFIDYYWNKKNKIFIALLKNNTSDLFYSDLLPFSDDDVIIKKTNNFDTQYFTAKYLTKYDGNGNSILFKFENLFLKQITENLSLKTWAGIEDEYYRAMIDCLRRKSERKWEDGIEQLNKEFFAIQEALREYLKTQVVSNEMYSRAISEIIYSPLIESIRTVPSGEKYDNILFLNFNYTDTTKLYFQEHKTHKIIHIHGKLDNPENPMIFGYGDEMDEKSKLIEDKNEKEYLVNNKSIRYLQTRNYQEMLAFIKADNYEIFVMGHSCGISDRTLLNTLFEHDHCKKIKPFYYEWKSKENNEKVEDNYDDIIINIYRNFKDKKLCRARVAPKPNCEPLPQLEKNLFS